MWTDDNPYKKQGVSIKIHPENRRNVDYARNWFSKKKWLPGMKLRLSNSESPHFGVLENAIFTISYQADMEAKLGPHASPVFAHQGHAEFLQDLERAYKSVFSVAEKHQKSISYKQPEFIEEAVNQ